MNLSDREQATVWGVVAVLLFVVLASFVYAPWRRGVSILRRELPQRRSRLGELNRLCEQYRRLKLLQGEAPAPGESFNLLAILEEAAMQAGVRAEMKSIRPTRGKHGDKAVAVEIDRVDPERMLGFLYNLEVYNRFALRTVDVRKQEEGLYRLHVQVQTGPAP